MPFGVANAPALFQELMNKILYILRRRPLVQELVSCRAEMEAHIDDVKPIFFFVTCHNSLTPPSKWSTN